MKKARPRASQEVEFLIAEGKSMLEEKEGRRLRGEAKLGLEE